MGFFTFKIHGGRVARRRTTDNSGMQREISSGSTELKKTDQTNRSTLQFVSSNTGSTKSITYHEQDNSHYRSPRLRSNHGTLKTSHDEHQDGRTSKTHGHDDKSLEGKNSIPEEPWSCTIARRKLVKNIEKQLCEHINSLAIVGYWKTKPRGKQEEVIDWEAMGQAMAESKFNQRKWAAKYMMGFFAHGKNMRWWKMRTATTCPRCREEDKDKTHVIRCKHKTAQQQWDKALTELENWMIMAKTKPMI